MNPPSRAAKMLLLAKQNIQKKPNTQSDATRDLLTFCDTFGPDEDLSTLLTDSTNLASSSTSNHHLLADDNLITDDDLLTLADKVFVNLNSIPSNFPEDEINIEPENHQNFVPESIHSEKVPNSILEKEVQNSILDEEVIEASSSRSDKSYEPSENETSSSKNEVLEELQNNTSMETLSRTRR